MGIDARHPEYIKNLSDWNKIDNVCDGNNVEKYLVYLNAHDKSEENKERNEAYKKRAVFYTLAGNTVSGMLGTVFEKWPTLNISDPNLAYLVKNVDGAGTSIYQQSQIVTEEAIRKGRCGMYVSFPPTKGTVSMADRKRFFATIRKCTAQQIINWRETTIDAETKLSLIVIEDVVEEPSATDVYTLELVKVIRELYIDRDVDEEGNAIGDWTYRERHWCESVRGDGTPVKTDPRTGRVVDVENSGWYLKEDFEPRDASGNPFNEILFTFVGAQNNNPDVDVPPMKGIVDLNIGHYRNSADYEDSIFYAGQAQPFIDAPETVTADTIKELQSNGVYFGSRILMPFKVGLAQQEPNSAVRQAMLDKVEQMVGIGARMMQPGSAVKTATQAGGEQKVQHSVLSLIASNVSEAYDKCLKWVAAYMGASGDLEYTLNQEYAFKVDDPQMLNVFRQMLMEGSMPVLDFIRVMKKFGHFREEKPDEEYAEEIRERVMQF